MLIVMQEGLPLPSVEEALIKVEAAGTSQAQQNGATVG